MTEHKKHKHADMIKAWVDDMSRVVEVKCGDDLWAVVKYIPWLETSEYRFADEVKVKVNVAVSPLSSEDLWEVWESYGTHTTRLTEVANAAHKAALKQVCAMPAVSSLTKAYRLYETSIANAAIARFLSELSESIGD